MRANRASVLVGLLWCLALLAVLVIGLLHTARLDLMVVKNYGDSIQARYLALAGIEKAKALIYHEAQKRKGSHQNHSGQLYNSPENFRDITFGRGDYRVFRQGTRDEGGQVIYGISDEESRLNVNHATAEELAKARGMTPEVVASIIDWRDADNNVTQNGAEAEYYMAAQPPYMPRNGPFETIRELLMVRGVTADLLFGEDANQNGLLDPAEDDGNETKPLDNKDGILDGGWSAIMTVDSLVGPLSAAGEDRVNIQTGDEASLAAVPGLSSELAKAIVAYRNDNKLETLASLLEVRAMQPNPGGGSLPGNPTQPGANGAQNPGAGPGGASPAQSKSSPTGDPLISQDLLIEVADDLTASSEGDQHGAVNINTASSEVLECLPGMTPELAQAIVMHRKSAGFFANIAAVLKAPGVDGQIFKQLAPRITARSETFRILCEGRVTSSGARKKIQAIIHLGDRRMETISYREDL